MIEPIADVVLSTVATRAIGKSADTLIDKISFKFARNRYDIIKFELSKGLPNYLAANYAKCETLKTLLNRNDPIPIEECFVAPDFKLKDNIVSSIEILDLMNQFADKVIITGLAGSGKSVFLKYSFRTVIERGYSYYPIFFELRSLNGLPARDGFLTSEIYKSVKSSCDTFSKIQFEHGLKNGAFYFLLDGFDELKHEIREQVSSEIQSLSRNHNKCPILVTSRPSGDFVSWEGFTEAELQPFNLEKALEYIEKLSFDTDKKRDFLNDLKNGLFESNRDFLSNPLLSAMMLLTYDSFGEIPAKRHIFYSKCFDVLAREHDASKGRYKRELYSNLTMEQLEQVFMFFCATSYSERELSFSEAQMNKYVGDAISYCGGAAQVSSVVRDFRESISIMELVGLNYEFAHRSFQEYFYAKFVVGDRRLSLKEKVRWLCEKFALDDTVEMIADMDQNYFEDDFLLPEAKSLDKKMATINPESNPAGILSKFFSMVHGSYREKQDDGEEVPPIYYTHVEGLNTFIWYQAMTKYREELPLENIFQPESKEQKKKHFQILANEYGGHIKIHHTNNTKLKKVGANSTAVQCKSAISLLRQHLEAKQEKRRLGLGALIRNQYGKSAS